MTTGASPISPEVFDFMRICFSAAVVEGYGMTETSCVITNSRIGDATSGHVGGPVLCCEVRCVTIAITITITIPITITITNVRPCRFRV
jgi:long-chain acyl-CoA synthetase